MLSKKNEQLKKKCVEHWFENLMLLQLNHYSNLDNDKKIELRTDISFNSKDCSFCKEYANLAVSCCEGCPIMSRTGSDECNDTPYYRARADVLDGLDYGRCFRSMSQEINFLMSL